ncbi:hypothetical protein L6452_41969 [Arctium lappa]|uniref:Uncharacterized protein n=1 Tax=Arctium lappa TaxID=4217 RepID=A0ACB8XGE9_ARCLA|nr:hypothetical protein L6452_41969 [Arctium lappa]
MKGRERICYVDINFENEQFQACVLWKEGKGMEFINPSLDDTFSRYKLRRCMQITVPCIEEKWKQRPSVLEVLAMQRNEYATLPSLPLSSSSSRIVHQVFNGPAFTEDGFDDAEYGFNDVENGFDDVEYGFDSMMSWMISMMPKMVSIN